MRVVYVLNTLAMGGTERQVVAIAERMAARGHTVALLVLASREPHHLNTRIEVLHLDIRKSLPTLISGLRRGSAFLRAFRPDIIHSHNFHGNMLARMLRLFHRRARLVSTIHNIYEGGRLRMLAYRISDCLAHRTTAVSHAVAQRFVRSRAIRSGKIIVLTNAIHTAHFIPDKERRAAMRARRGVADEFVWITVGRLAPAKDLNNLLAAFGQVSSQICSQASHPNPQLWIAGQPPSGTFEPHNLPIPDTARAHIRWLGLRRDIPALLDAADAFVLASAWEGMPLALGEAMAMAKPVVATDVGGVRELVGDAGLLVPAKDPDALASVLLAVMQQPEPHRSALGTRARVRILRDFDMDSRAGQWEALYQAVMGHSRARGPVVP